MDFIFSTAVLPLNGRSAGDILSTFFARRLRGGGEAFLKPTSLRFAEVLDAHESREYALIANDQVWLFDAAGALEGFFRHAPQPPFAWWAFSYVAPTDQYAFAAHGPIGPMRLRAGAEDMIHLDHGEIDSVERAELTEIAGADGALAAIEAWRTDGVFGSDFEEEGEDEELLSAAWGREMTFALMERWAGLRFDRPSARLTALEGAVVSEVAYRF